MKVSDMVRDYSQFLPPADVPRRARSRLDDLGWIPFLARQTSPQDMVATPPVRIVEVHRNGFHVLGDGIDALVPPGAEATVGDWLLFDRARPSASRVLERKSLFKRRAPGTDRKLQLIAANVDTVFVVTSCNDDFNVARLERYVALAFEAEVAPVIVLTKSDLCPDVVPFEDAARAISVRVPVVSLNALDGAAADALSVWCKPGQTVAFLGSSGVGKSTLVNALFGSDLAETAAIREDDSKGRHTTTRRQLRFTPQGCAVLDTPGMREIQLANLATGVADVFADISELAGRCRFRDCRHETEPGCAVMQAVGAGQLDAARLARWRKLDAEERFNSSTLAERKAGDKSLAKLVRTVKTLKKDRRR